MPKKAKKNAKIAKKSDSDDDDDFKIRKIPKKKGHKIAISDSDEDDDFSPKPSTLKGKISLLQRAFKNVNAVIANAISRIFWCGDAITQLIVVIAISRILGLLNVIVFSDTESDNESDFTAKASTGKASTSKGNSYSF